MRRALRTGLAAAATMLIAAPTAAATETQCTGFLTGTFDNIVVPENSFCRLQSSVVHGDVTALRDSGLIAVLNPAAGRFESLRPLLTSSLELARQKWRRRADA